MLLKKYLFIRSHDISLSYDYVSKEYEAFRILFSIEEIKLLKSLTIHYSATRYPNARIRFRIPEKFYPDVNRVKRVLEIVRKVANISKDLLKRDPKFGINERGNNVDNIISEYVEKIKKYFKIACIIVFGSRARGIGICGVM